MTEAETITDNVNEETPAFYGLEDDLILSFVEALRQDDFDFIRQTLTDWNISKRVELLEKLGEDDRRRLLSGYDNYFDSACFVMLDPDLRQQVLETMPARQVAAILDEVDSDDALDLIISLDDTFQQQIIRHLSARTRLTLEEGLSFPEDSAGRLMQREFIAVPKFWTVGKTIDYLRAAASELPAEFFDIFVIDPSYHVMGDIPLSRLVRAKRSEKLFDLALDETHPIPATMDQEEVAHLFRREGLSSAPVVDDAGRLIGVITFDDVVQVIDEEAQEDFFRLSGIEQGDLYRAILSTTKSRFRWLFINLLTAILASVVISFFDATIDQLVALAVLMPIVASMGGNAGTQALTIAVRALAMKDVSGANALRIIGKETAVGFLNGCAFAVIAGALAGFWFQDMVLGGVIASAMVINLVVAGFSGAGIPILLERFGSDPAVSSAVVLTTVTDVIGFLAFLGLASIFLI